MLLRWEKHPHYFVVYQSISLSLSHTPHEAFLKWVSVQEGASLLIYGRWRRRMKSEHMWTWRKNRGQYISLTQAWEWERLRICIIFKYFTYESINLLVHILCTVLETNGDVSFRYKKLFLGFLSFLSLLRPYSPHGVGRNKKWHL